MKYEGYQPSDRRPIASREWALSKRIARWFLARHVTANHISLVGMGFGILAGGAFVATSYDSGWERWLFFAGALGVQLRLLGNMLDGMVAIESQTASPVGELYNDVPDRISDSATLIGVGYALGGSVPLGFMAALLAAFGAYVRMLGKGMGLPQDFCGPMAKQHRMAITTLAAMYAAIAPTAWQPSIGQGTTWGIMAGGLAIVVVGTAITSVRRLLRIARQLRGPR